VAPACPGARPASGPRESFQRARSQPRPASPRAATRCGPRSYASWALGKGEGAYKAARGFVPAALEPQVASLEDAAVSAAAPLVARANDKVADLLLFADAKVGAGPREGPGLEAGGQQSAPAAVARP
jgi:hypothetical protein